MFLSLKIFTWVDSSEIYRNIKQCSGIIKAAENLVSGDFVEFIKDQDGELSCKKALELASISAIAARDIGERAKCSPLIPTVIPKI